MKKINFTTETGFCIKYNNIDNASLEVLCELFNTYKRALDTGENFACKIDLKNRITSVSIKIDLKNRSIEDLRYMLKNISKSELKISVFIALFNDLKNRIIKKEYSNIFNDLDVIYKNSPTCKLEKILYLNAEIWSLLNTEFELDFIIFRYNNNLFTENVAHYISYIYEFALIQKVDLKIKALVFLYNKLLDNNYPKLLEAVYNSIINLMSGACEKKVKELILKDIDLNTDLGFKLKMESLCL